jgi:hypothetical protein
MRQNHHPFINHSSGGIPDSKRGSRGGLKRSWTSARRSRDIAPESISPPFVAYGDSSQIVNDDQAYGQWIKIRLLWILL